MALSSSIMNIAANVPRGSFFDLVKAIGEAKSKQEEDRIIMEEMATLKQKMPTQATFTKKMKEYLVRLIYCEMLGHDASFGYIKAVELCASTNLLQKRVGYLAASLCLSPEHEFRFMLINQLTRDMASINYLEVCAALNAITKLTTVDTIPAVINDVIKLLKHEQELVRKKAVMALQRFYSLQPSSISHLDDKIRRALCDKDPSVMGAVLCLLYDLVKDNAQPYKDLVPSLVSILKQITDHRLPRDYDYHRMPAPWVQIHLLRILALLGNSDQRASEGMYEMLVDVMRRADTGINVGYAIVYECVRTVTTIYPNTVLLDAAASSIARFIGSDNHNLKYLGVKGLAAIVKDHPRYAAQHQLAVIDCLEDPDETLKRKTLDLLHRMTNPVNVEFITAKLLEYLEKATDVFLRTDLVQRISQSAERFAPSTSWYIAIMTRVFLVAGELVKWELAHTLMQLIAEGTGEDEGADTQVRKDAVENYVSLLEKPVLPDILVQTMSWILGEYGYLSEVISQTDLISQLCEIAHRASIDAATRGFVVTGVMKLVAQTGVCPPSVSSLLELYSESINLDLQQRCHEFLALLQHSAVMVSVLPVDASCEDLGVDESLSSLDGFVEEALNAGASRYNPPSEQDDEDVPWESRPQGPALKLTPYAKPEKPPAPAPAVPTSVVPPVRPSTALPTAALPVGPPATGLAPRPGVGGLRPVTQVWSRQGGFSRVNAEPSVPPAQQGPPPTAAHVPDTTTNHVGVNEPPKPRELTEKEKLAQALFGGIGSTATTTTAAAAGSGGGGTSISRPGSGAFTKSSSVGGIWGKSSPQRPVEPSSAPAGVHASLPPPVVRPAPPVPAVDFLDLGADDSESPAFIPPKPTVDTTADLMSLGLEAPVTLPQSDAAVQEPPAPPAPAPAPARQDSEDPFAALAAVTPEAAPLPGLGPAPLVVGNNGGAKGTSGPSFSYGGRILQPLPMRTQEFGGKWTQMRFQAPAANSPTTMRTLDLLGSVIASAGFHVVESIVRTSEVIGAGRFGKDGDVVLVHVKLYPQRGGADITVRCNDNNLGQNLGNHVKRLIA